MKTFQKIQNKIDKINLTSNEKLNFSPWNSSYIVESPSNKYLCIGNGVKVLKFLNDYTVIKPLPSAETLLKALQTIEECLRNSIVSDLNENGNFIIPKTDVIKYIQSFYL